VEAQPTPQAESVQALRPIQLRVDPLFDIEQVDVALRVRSFGSQPGERRLLTERRDAMAALAAELSSTSVVRSGV